MKNIALIFTLLWSGAVICQTNIHFSNPNMKDVLLGNYNPAQWGTNEQTPVKALQIDILNEIDAVNLKQDIIALSKFKTRHTASDTLSDTIGIGAARRWCHAKLENIATGSHGRLQVGYLEFDQDVCGVVHHKNVVAILPGLDTNLSECVIIEGHLDSRCETSCDANCTAEGVEDNATGSALVLELARVLSKSYYRRTIVFMLTTGEEQGLVGAGAMAKYMRDEKINLVAVLNNDVIGSIVCGKTASPPGCPGEDHVDSTQVRLFSAGSFNSKNKGLARYTKMRYNDVKHLFAVQMNVTIMSAEDRTGRGGDHIPFRQNGYPAIRFTSANEHGDASNGPDYHDRQHTEQDVLGADTDMDGEVDSFFVDFNYLKRNAQINALSAVGIANGPAAPDATFSVKWGRNIEIDINDDEIAPKYILGVRTDGNDFDQLVTIEGKRNMDVWVPAVKYTYVSICAVDSSGTQGLFSKEKRFTTTGVKEMTEEKVLLMSNKPNPFDETTTIFFSLPEELLYDNAQLRITDLSGRLISTIPVNLKKGMNEVNYTHGYGVEGIYLCSLIVNGKPLKTIKMSFSRP